MKLSTSLKVLAALGVALMLTACFGTEENTKKEVDYSTTELTWERILDGSGTYVLNDAVRAVAVEGFFPQAGPLTTYAVPGEIMTIRFSEDADETTGYLFDMTRIVGGEKVHEVLGGASINAMNQLVLDMYPAVGGLADANSIQPLSTTKFTIDGTIEKDLVSGLVYLKFVKSAIHAPEDAGAIGHEAFVRQ